MSSSVTIGREVIGPPARKRQSIRPLVVSSANSLLSAEADLLVLFRFVFGLDDLFFLARLRDLVRIELSRAQRNENALVVGGSGGRGAARQRQGPRHLTARPVNRVQRCRPRGEQQFRV